MCVYLTHSRPTLCSLCQGLTSVIVHVLYPPPLFLVDADTSKVLVEREAQRKKEERTRHKEYIHESREAQRKHLHNKYTLDFDQKGSKSKKTSSSSAPPPSSAQPASERQGGQDGDKKCIVS